MKAAAVVAAELVFSAMSLRGPGDRTSAASLRRLFETVFTLNMAQARDYCVEEPEWGVRPGLIHHVRVIWSLLPYLCTTLWSFKPMMRMILPDINTGPVSSTSSVSPY
jgi:hypothetical protein